MASVNAVTGVVVTGLGELPDDTIRKLVRRIAKGDTESRNRLAMSCYPLMKQHIRKYLGPGNEQDIQDCMQEGVIALMRAAEKYDPDAGSFANYAMWWIRHAIKVYEHKCQSIKIPALAMRKIRAAKGALNQLMSRCPEIKDSVLAMSCFYLSEGVGGIYLDNEETLEEVIDARELWQSIEGTFTDLTTMQRKVIELQLQGKSDKDISKALRSTSASVKQARYMAICKIRDALEVEL